MTRVVVVTTGGTIASRPRSESGSVTVADGSGELAAALLLRPEGVDIEFLELMQVGSYGMTVADMVKVAIACRELGDRPDVDGIVVTHGTDTMEETAYLIDLLHGSDVPVVFTGAQRNAAEPDCDGPRNLSDAIRVAGDPRARGLGAVICFGGRIDSGRNAVKMDTQALKAFGSRSHGPVGEVTSSRVEIYGRPPRPLNLVGLTELSTRVDVVALFAGVSGLYLRAARSAAVDGVVLECLGIGNANESVLTEVEGAIEDGITVLITSRCANGFVSPVYGDGGGADLHEAGAIFAGNLASSKARILLLAALQQAESDRTSLRAVLDPHLSG